MINNNFFKKILIRPFICIFSLNLNEQNGLFINFLILKILKF